MNNIMYEDRIVTASLAEDAATHGHIVVQPKKEVRRLTELSETESAHLFQVASYAAAILFQGLQAEGTNIICNEEEERLTVHIIARKNDDGLDFQWTPQQLNESIMKESLDRIKEKTLPPGAEKQEEKPTAEKEHVKQIIKDAEEKENYLIKQLIRIP